MLAQGSWDGLHACRHSRSQRPLSGSADCIERVATEEAPALGVDDQGQTFLAVLERLEGRSHIGVFAVDREERRPVALLELELATAPGRPALVGQSHGATLAFAAEIPSVVPLASAADEFWLAWQSDSYGGKHLLRIDDHRVAVARIAEGGRALRTEPVFFPPVAIPKFHLRPRREVIRSEPPSGTRPGTGVFRPEITFDPDGRLWASVRQSIAPMAGWAAVVRSLHGEVEPGKHPAEVKLVRSAPGSRQTLGEPVLSSPDSSNPPPADLLAIGRDVDALAFCVLTDHGWSLDDPSWWSTQEIVARYRDPGRVLPLLDQEWTSSGHALRDDPPFDPKNGSNPHTRFGHHNLIYENLHYPKFYDSADGPVSPADVARESGPRS